MPYKNARFWVALFVGGVLVVCAGVALMQMAGRG